LLNSAKALIFATLNTTLYLEISAQMLSWWSGRDM